MKVYQILIILILSYFLVISGAAFKILHYPGADAILITGIALKTLAIILGIWKVITSIRRSEDFRYMTKARSSET